MTVLFPSISIINSCHFISTTFRIFLSILTRNLIFIFPYIWSRIDLHQYIRPFLSRYFDFLPMELSVDGLNEQKKATQPTSTIQRYKVVVRNIRKSIHNYDLLENFSMVAIKRDYISLIGQDNSGNKLILDVLSGFTQSCCRCSEVYVNNQRDYPVRLMGSLVLPI